MSKIKLIFVLLAVLLVSCDTDTSLKEIDSEKSHESVNFLEKHFSTNYSKGETMIMNYEPYKITEIISSSQKTPIGYTVEDKTTHEFLYFLEINLNKNSYLAYDIKSEIIDSFDLNELVVNLDIKSMDNFSFLNVIDVDMNTLNTKRKRPFWGKRCGDCSTGLQRNFRTCCRYALWIRIDCWDENC